ncbi:hypothetical protein MUA02_01300 [Enterobacteriaceae bacterium H20N1]|uniref:HTH luxR-type domain-containing protein n=1 Tax=Dryocola boscaweniae TaxID=2925397 RepID=A0A9X2W772_9ENTR|nr:hypothetical protein [Dryocola boscaweniae]MCT4700544.1 hypothetical protein [Dryocola boscaweniae]MCT4717700.1 hypothetical protein [Dryocola boscaweniae]
MNKTLFCEIETLHLVAKETPQNVDRIICFSNLSFPLDILRINKHILLISKTTSMHNIALIIFLPETYRLKSIDIVLSKNELQTLKLWKKGYSSQAIASEMNKSIKAIYRYKNTVLNKCKISKPLLFKIMDILPVDTIR